MRRRLVVLSTAVLALLLTALPALAADGNGAAESGDDLWTGLIYAMVGGVILGVIAFVDSTTGANELDGHDAH